MGIYTKEFNDSFAHDFYVGSMKGHASQKDIEDNKRLVRKFPWLWPSDWSWERIREEEYDYSWTVLDEFPKGWKKAFGEKMCEEIQAVLVKHNSVEKFHIDQLKEKFAAMRLYFSGVSGECSEEIHGIVRKYEEISAHTCCECGSPAGWISIGWLCPYCYECADRSLDRARERYPEQDNSVESNFAPMEEFYRTE